LTKENKNVFIDSDSSSDDLREEEGCKGKKSKYLT